jgi:bla regulator protein BlaR1
VYSSQSAAILMSRVIDLIPERTIPIMNERAGNLSCCSKLPLIAFRSVLLTGLAASSLMLALPVRSQVLHATGPLPSYEVATIKPWDGMGFARPLRAYIAQAFNLNSSSVSRLIGPDWINKKSYVIRGKVPDSLQDAMQKMAPEERWKETQLMQQSLLADRFKMKVHFETHEMPVFELVTAKDGSKLKEVPPLASGGASMGPQGQRNRLIDGRTVIDKTGLTGRYDISLEWVPTRLAAVATPGILIQPGTYGSAPPPDTDGPSLFTALQEQLGLKLVPSKGPVEVVVIDSIELPSEN